MLKIKSYLKKPIILFSFISLIFIMIMLLGVHFQLPDFYIDREAAWNAAQQVASSQTNEAAKKFENINYKIYNPIFQLFGLFLVLTFCTAVFKIVKFRDFLNINLFKSKKLIFLWINLSYIFYAVCILPAYMADLEIYVYNSGSDSMGIPFFTELFSLLFFAIIYYPLTNILFYLTYNTKIKGKFYIFLYCLGLIFFLWNIVSTFLMKFTYFHFYLYFFNIVWILLILNSIKVLKDKNQLQNMP